MAPVDSSTVASRARSAPKLVILALLALVLFAGFIVLGNWQVRRLGWKLALIQRVDQRVDAAPVAPPGPTAWPAVNAARDEYRHVRASGHYLNRDETLVHASTRLGYGFWVMTPLQTAPGFIVLVNRGFVPAALSAGSAYRALPRPTGPVTVTGLLRISEPHGGFLHANRPAEQRWYSRDVAAIARHLQLPTTRVAPYFIDADAASSPGPWPAGGLTVVHFRNAHLQYVITWYLLGFGVLIGAAIVARHEWRLRHPRRRSSHD